MYHLDLPPNQKPRLLLTTALPYANGPLHVGHMAEAVQACAFARYRRLCGQEVHFLGADDAHGTAIEISAEAKATTPEAFIAKIQQNHITSYAAFDISYDAYHSTHSPENAALVNEIFQKLKDGGHLEERDVRQLFDLSRGRTLEDRRVRGTCPECGATDQPGDSCDKCGATYNATQLIDPVSTFSGEPPVTISAKHLFFRLTALKDRIHDWLSTTPLQPQMQSKVLEWLDGDLRDWCLTRTGPYFGFPVPNHKNLFFYVWVDAPVGYIASLEHRLKVSGAKVSAVELWNDEDSEKLHIIGKDIINFHALLWPGLLHASGLALPNRIHAHGFLTIAGQKMSKSKGNFVLASELARAVDSDALRWLLASRLGGGTTDIDLEANAALEKINSDLAGKFANIPLRLRPFLADMGGTLATTLNSESAYQNALDRAGQVLASYEAINLAEAVRGIIALADEINRDIAAAAPWKMKDAQARAAVVTDALVRFRVVAALTQPIAPILARRALGIFGEQSVPWRNLATPPLGERVAVPERLFERLEAASLTLLSRGDSPTLA